MCVRVCVLARLLCNSGHNTHTHTLRTDIHFMEHVKKNNAALQAYRNHVTMYGKDPPLPGIDLSHDQLFFLNFAQVLWLVRMDGQMK